jgi:hypothetical protein
MSKTLTIQSNTWAQFKTRKFSFSVAILFHHIYFQYRSLDKNHEDESYDQNEADENSLAVVLEMFLCALHSDRIAENCTLLLALMRKQVMKTSRRFSPPPVLIHKYSNVHETRPNLQVTLAALALHPNLRISELGKELMTFIGNYHSKVVEQSKISSQMQTEELLLFVRGLLTQYRPPISERVSNQVCLLFSQTVYPSLFCYIHL